jgi:hypothetical protein
VRRKNLEFHIESQDYFGTLATILNLLHQKEFDGNRDRILKEKVAELMDLQKNYQIIRKDESKKGN